MAQDLYAVLGVKKDADAETIKKAYRKMAKDLHPDKHKGSKNAEDRFKAVNHAFDVLGDGKKRKLYDEFGEEGLREGFDPDRVRAYRQWGGSSANRGAGSAWTEQAVNLEDLFGQRGGNGTADVFGDLFGRARGGRRAPPKGQDVESEVTIDLASALRGTTLELRLQGSPTPVTVRIPPGAGEGSRVRVTGHGASSPMGGPPGDLLLVLHVQHHPHFRLEGDDLHLDLPITAHEAYFGAKVKVPTIDGSVQLTVPPHSQSGGRLRLRGKGVARKGKPPGDLYVHFLVRLPEDPAPEVGELIEKLAAFQVQDVRADVKL